MKRVLITILAIGFPFIIKAQLVDVKEKTSGFFGKRFMIGCNSLIGLSNEPQKADLQANLPSYSMNKSFDLSLYYALNNRFSLGIRAGRSNTSINLYDYQSFLNKNQIYYTDNLGKEYYVSDIMNSPTIKDKFISIELKHFRALKGAFSPLGAHFTYGLNLHRYEVDISNVEIHTYTNDYSSSHPYQRRTFVSSTPLSYKTLPEIFIGYGYSAPIFKKFIFNFGVRSGLLLTYAYLKDQYSFEASIENAIYTRLQKKEIINYNFGIHYAF